MASEADRYRSWSLHLWAVAVLLVAAALGPLIYCLGFGELASAQEAGWGVCLESHPLQFPATIFVAGLVAILAGVILRIQAQQAQEQAERVRKRRERAVQQAGREASRTPRLDKHTLKGIKRVVPDEIDVEDDLDLEQDSDPELEEIVEKEDPDSVMAFLQEEQQAQALRRDVDSDSEHRAKKGLASSGKYYVPPGLEGAPVLYLEPDVAPGEVDELEKYIDNPNRPFGDVNQALRQAFRIVLKQSTPVVVRAKPGVYQAAVEIPDRVTVINHRMPASASVDQRVEWLRGQDDIDHPERVTFLAPSDSEFGVRVMPGRKQGLFGCHVVGRRGVAQTGLRAKENMALAIVHCAFETCSRSGVEVADSGEDLDGRRVQFVGCVWRNNSAVRRGGGLVVENSAVRIEASIFDGNRAPRGGAIAVADSKIPLMVQRSLLQRNRAVANDVPSAVDVMKLEKWKSIEGVGGAMMVEDGLVRVVDCVVEGNDAAVGGGAIASLGGRVVIKSTGDERGVCKGNRACAGGGLLAVGWPERPALIRIKEVQIIQNLAKTVGGGAAAIGNAVLHCEHVQVETNRAEGGKRGVGGGIAAWRGAAAKLIGGEVVSNQVTGGGGGIAVLNGSLMLTGRCAVKRNRCKAKTGGGGVLALTTADRDLERYIGQQGFSLPFKLKIERVRITLNDGAGPGGGLRAGNLVDGVTFPLAVSINPPEWITGNETGADQQLAENIWIQWAGELRVNDDAPKTIKLALK